MSLSKVPFRESFAVKKILILRLLFEENLEAVTDAVKEMLMKNDADSNVNTGDILDWLNILLPRVLQIKITDVCVIEKLLDALAAREFYHNWKCFEFSIRLSVKLRLSGVLTKLYTNSPLMSFAESLDVDCQVAKELWNAGLDDEEFLMKHIKLFLSGYLMAPINEEVKSHALLACIPAGLEALGKVSEGELRDRLISNMGKILSEDSLNTCSLPAVQILKARLLVLSDGKFQFDPHKSLTLLCKDLVGLLTFAMVCLGSSDVKYQAIVPRALLKAIRVDPVEENKQLLVTAAMEMMAGCLLTLSAQDLEELIKIIR